MRCCASACFGLNIWRPVASVLREIDHQAYLGAEDIAFYDDALLLQKERYFIRCAMNLGQDMQAFRFHTPNGLHVREIDEECALTLKETGFKDRQAPA